MGILIVLAVVLAAFSFWMYRSADKSEERFANRPSVITNPEKDLFSNQKYAIVKLLAFIQGASPLSAFNEEANRIAQSTIFSFKKNTLFMFYLSHHQGLTIFNGRKYIYYILLHFSRFVNTYFDFYKTNL